VPLLIRDIRPDESDALGRLLVEVYAGLAGFPTPREQPRYYEMLARIGEFTDKKDARVLVATDGDAVLGGVVYFGEMSQYDYERMGFRRTPDRDFMQAALPVFGFEQPLRDA
jgi:hypothetical protein